MARHVLVLGGGIVGAVIASRLLDEEDDVQLTLVDAGLAGGGSSMYSAGVHFPCGRTERIKALSSVGALYYSGLHAREPSLPIHPFDMQVIAARERAAEVEAHCVGLEPITTSDVFGNAVWRLPDCHASDVQHLTQWHVARLRNRASVLEGTRVREIEEREDSVRVSFSCGRKISAQALVLAPGPWANDTPFQSYTAPLGIRTKKVVALHINRPLSWGTPTYFPLDDAFLAPLPHRGHWLFSYTCPQWDVRPDELGRSGIEAAELEEARSVASRIAPHLVPHILSGRAFCDAYSPKREPIASPVSSHGRVIFAGASNGSGYRLAPGIAHEVVGLLKHIAPPSGGQHRANHES